MTYGHLSSPWPSRIPFSLFHERVSVSLFISHTSSTDVVSLSLYSQERWNPLASHSPLHNCCWSRDGLISPVTHDTDREQWILLIDGVEKEKRFSVLLLFIWQHLYIELILRRKHINCSLALFIRGGKSLMTHASHDDEGANFDSNTTVTVYLALSFHVSFSLLIAVDH